MIDNTNPDYYKKGSLESIDIIAECTASLKGEEAFCTGNALKYLCRWKEKNGHEDLRKARWYINRILKEEKTCVVENEDSTTKARVETLAIPDVVISALCDCDLCVEECGSCDGWSDKYLDIGDFEPYLHRQPCMNFKLKSNVKLVNGG